MAPEPRPPFATFLLPSLSLPFRRRQSSTASITSTPSLSFSPRSSISTSPSTSPPTTYKIPNPKSPAKGLLHEALHSLPTSPTPPKQTLLHRAHPNTLRCITCSTDIAFASQIVSKGFTGRHGRAYLVAPPSPPPSTRKPADKDQTPLNGLLINIKIGRNVNRELLTGTHVVADVSCVICHSVLGWKYVDAREAAQKYKIGKFILEMKRVVQGCGWEDGVGEVGFREEEQEEEQEEEEEEDGVVLFDDEDEDECEDLFSGVWDAETVAKRRSWTVGGRR